MSFNEIRYAYSDNEELFNCDSEFEAIDSLLNHHSCDVKIGDVLTIYKGRVVEMKPSEFVSSHDVDTLLEAWNERANDNVGESADDYLYFVSEEIKDELLKILEDFNDKHFSKEVTFYAIRDVVEIPFMITEELLKSLDLWDAYIDVD